MRRSISIMSAVTFGLLLVAMSCKSKVAEVNVNINAAAQTVTNTAKAATSRAVQERVTKETAVAEAKTVFAAQEALGTDFSSGPCLSNNLFPDWVADVAHSPRQSVDDQPENQCRAYRDGTAHHFVELDQSGQLIRAQ